jgi:hypothetical protein
MKTEKIKFIGMIFLECKLKTMLFKDILSKERNTTCEKILFTSNFQHHFKYRNKHYITLKFGTLKAVNI